jgi:hypothetical protein
MGFNEIVFGGMALIGILIFLYIGRYRAGASQRNRGNKIRWNFLSRRGRRR